MSDSKSEINARVKERLDALTGIGKRGYYETIFRVVHEERAVATDKARREAWEQTREECARAARGLYDYDKCDYPPGYMDGRMDAEASIRILKALTPQNPGDAAPESEHG